MTKTTTDFLIAAKAATCDTDKSAAEVATDFLRDACPDFLTKYGDDNDRLTKVGRAVTDLLRATTSNDVDTEASLKLLVQNCDVLVNGLDCPKVRFGKTNIMISRVTCGGMRFQQAWGAAITSMDQVSKECQENVVDILKHAINSGINHIETARGYGSSELQVGVALEQLFAEGFVKREDLIIQTKVNPSPTAAEFREVCEKSFSLLKLDYVDLFSFHGMNLHSHYDLLFNNGENGNLYDVVQEYIDAGKIRHVGFSTHGMPDLIKRLIETDKFGYANIHYHYFGSYTASGSGPYGGNLENVRLCQQHDMGVFIISPYDKGGRLYAPSRGLRSLCLPDLEPITFGSLWLWMHDIHDEMKAPVHTIVCGSARPSDMDEPVIAAMLLSDKNVQKITLSVAKRLNKAMEDAVGTEWAKSWFNGLPDCYETKHAAHIAGIIWLYNLIKAYGMVDFAIERYGILETNHSKWDQQLTYWENVDKIGSIGWGYMPGCAFVPGTNYKDEIKACPDKNKGVILDALEFVHQTVAKEFNTKERDSNCETAYDMRPWTVSFIYFSHIIY